VSIDTPPPRPHPSPRIEVEGIPAPRLEAERLARVAEPERGVGTIPLVVGGAGVLVLGLAGLQTVNFVAAQFARSDVLGGLTLTVAVIGFGSTGAGVWRELRALLSLRTVDHLRAELSGPDPSRTRPALRRWPSRLPEGQAVKEAVETIEDRAVGSAARGIGRRVGAVQILAAAVPSPAFDGLLMAWRWVRLVRQVAALHGLRPGLIGTLKLLRYTILAAAGVMATDLAVATRTRAVLSGPLLAHVAGDVVGAGVAARRMIVLACATAAACSPVPPG
jgi:putative membrane protein